MQHNEIEREFTFREVVRRVWTSRVLLILTPLLAACVGIVLALTFGTTREIISYHIRLVGIEDGLYPNGMAFSPADLKSAAVLATLSERFELPVDRLERSISINYDNPAASGIEQKYQQRLGARNLQPPAIDSINRAFLEELSASINSGLRIEVNYGLLSLPPEDAIALAFAIPSAWNETFLTRYRVLANPKLVDAGVTEIPNVIFGTAKLLIIGTQLGKIEEGLKIISEDNRLSGLITSEGMTPEDLKYLLREFRTVYYDPVIVGGFSSVDDVATSLRAQLKLHIEDLGRQIEGLDKNLARIPTERYAKNTDPMPLAEPTFDQGSLDTIISLVQRSSFMSYTQDLLERRQSLVEEMSRTQARLDSIVLKDVSAVPGLPARLSQTAEEELKTLTSKYRSLYAAAQSKYVESSGVFYAERTTPTTSLLRNPLADAALIASVAMVGFLLAVIYALTAPSIQSALGPKKSRSPTPIRMVAST